MVFLEVLIVVVEKVTLKQLMKFIANGVGIT